MKLIWRVIMVYFDEKEVVVKKLGQKSFKE